MSTRWTSLPALLSLALAALAISSARAAGDTYMTYGADTSPVQRDAIAQFAGFSPSAPADTVTTAEMVDALQGSGVPIAATDKSYASSALTCLNRGDGIVVRTQNITRITPSVYAAALIAAGAADGNVLIVAPQDNQVSGETALVGALKDFVHCQTGKPLSAARASLAYKQIAWSVAAAGSAGDLNHTSAMLLKAEMPVVTGQAKDDTAIASGLDAAAAAEGVAIDPAQRPALIDFLRAFEHLDFGGYAKGYALQPESPTQAKIVPTATGETLTGVLQRDGPTLTVRVNGRDRQIEPAPNATVTRNGRGGAIAGLRKGDNVTIATNPDGSARRIDATSAAAHRITWWKWAIPFLVVAGLLILIPIVAARGRRDAFILQPNDIGPARAAPPAAEEI